MGDAQFTLNLLDKGVEGKKARDIANELDSFGAHLELKVGYDFSMISLYALKKNIARLLPLLYSIIQKPTLPQKEFETLKNISAENLKVSLSKNDFICSNHIRKKIFGSHPYGRSITLEETESLDLESIKRFFRDRFKPHKVFIVGNIDDDILKSITKNIDLRNTQLELQEFSLVDSNPSYEQLRGPNNTQASIRLGCRTISRTHPDWAGLRIANHILGGFFGSRLMRNIREEKGLTYGIHSSLQSLVHSTWISISAEVNSVNADLALDEIRKELDNLKEIGNEELELAKNHFIGSLQNDITTIFSASERTKDLILNGLPLDFFETLIQSIDAFSKETLYLICFAHLSEKNFSSISVK